MKKQKDAGLQYLLELGIRPAKDKQAIEVQMADRLGKDEAHALMTQIWNESDARRLYALKNRDITTAITFSGCYDGDIYRKACNWIDGHKHVFGKEILEVGCDSGILSCFLGRLFPDATITSIDRTEEALAVARQLADKLQVHNVTFLLCDLSDLDDKQYDTVFSMRTMHENITNRDIQPSFALLLEQATLYGNTVADYAEQLAARVKDGGTLVSIERGEKNPMFLGWLFDLQACGLMLQTDCYAELCCTAVGQPAYFQAISATKAAAPAEHVYAFWCSLFSVDWSGYQFTGWEAETLLQNTVHDLGDLLEGYVIFNQEGDACGKYAVWPLKSRPDAVLYYQGNGEKTTVGLYAATILPDIRRQLQTILSQCRQQQLVINPLESEKDSDLK